MSKFEELQKAILALPEPDYVQLRLWFGELDWKKWDERIEMDSEDGRLDFLVDQALRAKSEGALLDL